MVLKRVLVTGASGMVGRQLVDLVHAEGLDVVATARTCPPTPQPGVDWVPLDLMTRISHDNLSALFGPIDAIIHCAAMIPASDQPIDEHALIDVNVDACLMLGGWARAIDVPMVFLSSASVYRDVERRAIREDAPLGANPVAGLYGITKLMAENAFSYLQQQGLRVATLRPTSVYGPGLPDGKMVRHFLTSAAEGKTITLQPPFNDRFNLIHAADVARAAWLALNHQAWDIFNVANGALISIEDIARTSVRVAGRGNVSLALSDRPQPPVIRFDLDGTKAAERLSFHANISIEEGLRTMHAQALVG